MKFTSGQSKIREERSNAGVQALAQSIFTNLLGITQGTASEIMDLLQQTGEDAAVRQNLKLLSITAHTRLNQILDVVETTSPDVDDDLDDEQIDDMVDAVDDVQDTVEPDYDDYDPLTGPDDPDNVQVMDYSKMRPNDDSDWTPDEDREEELEKRAALPPVADKEDYLQREGASKKSFLSFLNEMSREGRVDAEIAKMSDEADEDLDPATKKRIDQAEAKGDTKRAATLRDQAKRRAGTLNANKPKRPTQQRVMQKKRELADALKRDRQAAEGE